MIAHLFSKSAKAYPDRPAIHINSEVLTYSELASRAGQISECLQTVTSGQATCILLTKRSFVGFAGILGILGSGNIYVPISPTTTEERAVLIASKTSPSAIIADRDGLEFAKLIAKNSSKRLAIILPEHELSEVDYKDFLHHKVFYKSDLAQFSQEYNPINVKPKSLAYILFTSGTTGEPKGVPIRQESVFQYVKSMASLYPLSPNDRCTQLFELTFDLSGHDMFVTWNAGACLFVPHRGMALFSADLVKDNKLTVWFSVPSVVSELMRSRKLKPNSFKNIRLAIFCGERMPVQLAQAMRVAAPKAKIVNIYGPTEATIAFTHYTWDGKDLPDICGDLPIGKPLPDQKVFLLDSNRHEVPPNTVGEMYLAGSQVSDGYWKNSTQTKAHFHKLSLNNHTRLYAYSTGDLAIDIPGIGLVFRGRIDDQVKLHGVRMELGAIEAAVRRVGGGQQVAAIVWPQDYPKKLIVYIEKGKKLASDVLEKCKNLLPYHEQPDEVLEIDNLPLTSNGKMDRKKLITYYEEQMKNNTNTSLAETLPLPTVKDIESTVYSILAKQHTKDSSFLPSFKSDEDLIEHTDSLGFINMILELEKKYFITIKDWRAVTRLDKLVRVIIKARGDLAECKIETKNTIIENEHNMSKIQRGLLGVILDYSSISDIDGKNGYLSYCGTPIHKFVDKKYLDVSYLLYHGRYPTKIEQELMLKQYRLGQKYAYDIIEQIDTIFSTGLSPIKFILSVIPLFKQKSSTSQWLYGLQLQGFVSAAIGRHASLTRGDLGPLPKINKSLPEWMLLGLTGHQPSRIEKKAIESLFVMLAECITNPGTFAARTATSTDADYISSVVAALAVFSGTKHGGATDNVMTMIEDIADPSRSVDWVKKAQIEKRPVPGFGHRVFQVPDPRAALIANWVDKLVKEGANPKPMDIITKVNEAMAPLRRHGTYVNVDAYTGALLTILGVPCGYGTLVFTLARMAGWNAHVQEQKLNNIMINPGIIYRPRKVYN